MALRNERMSQRLPGASAETFLGAALEKRTSVERVPHGFGAELDHALAARRQWLLTQGIGLEGEEGFAIDRDWLHSLARGAIEDAAGRLAGDLRREYVPAGLGARIDGAYRRPIDLPAGRFAIIERSKEFTLVPWRDVLEQCWGLEISGIVQAGGINWDLERRRGGPAR